MTEKGGPATQGGIEYQNTLAARYLADLLELTSLPPRERVLEVRVESPDDVDDIVIRFADGHRDWIQAKSTLKASGETWKSLWLDFKSHLNSKKFESQDRIVLVIGSQDDHSSTLQQLSLRAETSTDVAELRDRLGKIQRKCFDSIALIVGSEQQAMDILRRCNIEVASLTDLRRVFSVRDLDAVGPLPSTFLAALQSIATAGGKRRETFVAPHLRRRLKREFGIEIAEPFEWGLTAYRSTVKRLARIEIPGTGISAPANEMFVWPRACDYDRSAPADFEDDHPHLKSTQTDGSIDLKLFPSNDLDHCIVVAGPGFGKSALLSAICDRLADGPYVPAIIPLTTFAATDLHVIEYLQELNREFDVRIDWSRLAEQGLAVMLFDGLDEIPTVRRRIILDRIALFSARHHRAPWILTVRDPAVLAGPADGRIIEFLPLDSNDISNFIDVMKSRVVGLDNWSFTQSLEAYPDLAKLARIPLFLMMLIARVGDGGAMPSTRSNLIEGYLKSLFTPHEYKSTSTPVYHASVLRKLTEAIAFDRVLKQSIGTTEREVREIAARFTDQSSSIDSILGELITCGILRRDSWTMLRFPYPIVQEYLAACHLVRDESLTLLSQVADAVQRPWAQVIQFSLELHAAPQPIIEEMLKQVDDAFATSTRIVARCIANGASVDARVWEEVTRRLAGFWDEAPYHTRERIGRLIADSFVTPLIPEVRQLLSHRWLQHDGAGEIVTKINDAELTREVLKLILEDNLDGLMVLHELQPAINKLGDEAFRMYAERARRIDTSEEQLRGLSMLIGALDPKGLSLNLNLDLALDSSMPDNLRLAAFSLTTTCTDERADPLINRCLESDGDHWICLGALAKTQDVHVRVMNLITEDKSKRLTGLLIEHLPKLFPDKSTLINFIQYALKHPGLDKTSIDLLGMYLARHGDRAIFEEYIDRFATLDVKLMGLTLALFGHYQVEELGARALDELRDRTFTNGEVTGLANSIATGMTGIFQMDSLFSGGINRCFPHPSIQSFADLVRGWSNRDGFIRYQKIDLLKVAADLGHNGATEDLYELIAAVEDPNEPDLDESDGYGHILSSALSLLRKRRRRLPLPVAERFARAKIHNVPNRGIEHIADHGNLAALDLLLSHHGECEDWHTRSTIIEYVEILAGRLGIKIRAVGKQLLKDLPT